MDQQVDLDVEGLFNEEPTLGENGLDHILPVSEHAVLQDSEIATSPALLERIFDLVYSGCLKRVACGRQGHITTISDDDSTVNLQCLRTVPGTDRWKLSTPHQLDRVFEKATTLAWSPSGVDLAVVDQKGQVSFFTMTTACMNRLNEVKHDLVIPHEEQGQPIVTFWLNQDRPERPPRSVVLSITNQHGVWTQNLSRAKSFPPQLNRAFLMINKNGIVSLTYQLPAGPQGASNQYHRVAVPVSVTQCGLFTHGAVAATTEGKLIIALYNTQKHLSVYRLQIDWPTEWRTNPSDPTQPLLTTEVLNINVPKSRTLADDAETSLNEVHPSDGYVLTHLEIVPTSDVENSVQLPPQIWAVFTLLNQSLSPADPSFLQPSVIKRWSVTQSELKLHPKFAEMAQKSEVKNKHHSITSINKQSDTHFPQTIINIELVDGGQQVAITTIDGHVELWNPFTMNPASMDGNTNEVTSIAQSGFSFGISPSTISNTLSPNASLSINLQPDGKASINQALYLGQPLQSFDITDAQQSAAATSIILALARALFLNSISDDVLSFIPMVIPHPQGSHLIKRLYSICFKPAEFIHEKAPSSQLGQVVRNRLVQKVLSFHLSLYSAVSKQPLQANGFPHPSTWSRLWAWIITNVRHLTSSFYFLHTEIQPATASSQPVVLAPSYLDMISNLIKYIFDLYRFIFETILEVGDRKTNPEMFDEPVISPYFNLGDEKGDGSQGLVALLLNCNWSRCVLLAAAKAMHSFLEKADSPNPNIRHVVASIRRYSYAKGLSLGAVEQLLNGKWYQRIGLADNEQYDLNIVAERQIEMMATGRVGQYYQNTIKNLLANAINGEHGIRSQGPQEMSRLKLFTDVPQIPWLLLNMESCIPTKNPTASVPSKPSKRNKSKPIYDILKKTPITIVDSTETPRDRTDSIAQALSNGLLTVDNDSPQMIRRCSRCGSVSEDLKGARWDWPRTLLTYNVRCVCDGFFIMEPLDGAEDDEDDDARQVRDIDNETLKLLVDEVKELQ